MPNDIQPPSAQNARIEAEIARTRAAVAAAEQNVARGTAQVPPVPAVAPLPPIPPQNGSDVGVTTNTGPDGSSTTIVRDGNDVTTIKSFPDGHVTISSPAHGTTTLNSGGPGDAVARLMARLAERQQGFATTTTPSAFPPREPETIPEGVIPLVAMIFSLIVATIIFLPIARAIARRMDRKTNAPMVAPDMTSRFDRIEQAIETMAVEVERVSEAQRYSARLLTERLPEARVGAGAETVARGV